MDESQIIIIGIVASVLTWILKYLASLKVKPNRVIVNITLYIISVVLALLWTSAVVPSLPQWNGDVAAFVGACWMYLNEWIAVGAPILGSATFIYNLLYEKVIVPLFLSVKRRFAK